MKPKAPKKRKPGGGRRSLYKDADLIKVSIRITKAQRAHLKGKGEKNNISDGARKVITHDMAMDLTKGESNET